MRFVLDQSLDRGRVVISKDGGIIAVAPTVEALVVVSHAVVVGEELRAHPDTMLHVKRWSRRRRQEEDGAVRLHSNDQIAPGHVLVTQPGDVLLCKLAELIYELGEGDADTAMIVNPCDIDVARAKWFGEKGAI